MNKQTIPLCLECGYARESIVHRADMSGDFHEFKAPPEKVDHPAYYNAHPSGVECIATPHPLDGDLIGPYCRDPRDAEIARLKARVDDLLEHSTALRLELRVTDRKRMVREFHAKFDQVIGTEPKVPDDAAVRFRMRLAAEEFFELVVATYGDSKIEPWRLERLGESLRWVVENCPVEVDLPAFMDAHVDLGWILEGTCVSFGVDSTPMWREVARSNMAKSTGEKRGDGKIQKPEGWVGPDIEGALKAQGWRR